MAEDSLAKFMEHLVVTGHTGEEDAQDVAGRLADVVASAWGFEGRSVELAGNAADDRRDPREVVDRLVTELEQLQTATSDALTALRRF